MANAKPTTTIKLATQTGAAKDDIFAAAVTGLSEDNASGSLNVLVNDPGAAKLYSLYQGDPVALASSSQMPILTTTVLKNGAVISMNADGTVGYNAAGVTGLQALALGESYTDSFQYTVRMANGATSTALVSVQLAGANDAPVLASVARVSVADTSSADAGQILTGALAASDVDHGAVLSYSFADGSTSISNAYGTITLDTNTGSYSFDLSAAALNGLVGGQTVALDFSVVARDEHGAVSNGTSIGFDLVGADEATPPAPNPVTAYMVNHGQTDINGRQTIYGFDANDVLKYAQNYTRGATSQIDTDGDGIADSSAVAFDFVNNGGKESHVEVVLVGYLGMVG